jgi:peptidoglycan pentaglycine glycine transferase (the first glycine)
MLMLKGQAACRAGSFSGLAGKTSEGGNGFEDRTRHRPRNTSIKRISYSLDKVAIALLYCCLVISYGRMQKPSMTEQAPLQLLGDVNKDRKMLNLHSLEADQRVIWDKFVADTSHGHLLQSWAWGELKDAFGWRALRVALWDQDRRSILAGAQVLFRPLPVLPFSIAYIPKGPLLDWSDAALCQRFFQALHPLLHARRAAFLRIDPDLPESVSAVVGEGGESAVSEAADTAAENTLFGGLYSMAQGLAAAQQLRSLGFRAVEDSIQPRRTIAVDLLPDEKAISLRQKPKWRYNAGLAARKGVTVRPAASVEDLRRWYALMRVTSERDRFAVHTFDYYQRAWELMKAAHQAELFLAEHEGKLLAGIFVTLVGREGIYLYGASGNDGRNVMPNHLLQWEAMRWCKARGATLYDLWGIAESEDPNDPMAGVYRFKRGWGGKMVRYIGSFDYIYSPLIYRGVRQGLEFLKRREAARLRRQRDASEPAQEEKDK